MFPEIRIPLPKLHVAYVSRAVPGFGSVAPSLTDLRPGVVCGGVSEASELDYPADGLIDLFGSVEDYRTALAATKVEIVALRPVVDEFVTPSENAERAVTLREEDASILKAVLTYDPAYDWTAASPVPSHDGYRVKFHAPNRVVVLDVFLSSRCTRAPRPGRVPPSARLDFGYATAVAIITRYFPGAAD